MNFHRIKEILNSEHTLLDDEWKGAVVFLCNEEHVFFIKRSELMPSHAGQIAFVGGHKQLDESNAWIVAQREFEEETSLDRSIIEFQGYLPLAMTARLQPIVPVVAKLKISTEQFLKDVKSNGEWDEILAYPWSELMKEDRWEYAIRNGNGATPFMFHTIRAGTYLPKENNLKPHLLWGATASMVWALLRKYFK
jgi:8-oxo-dGTP pyrophosphatase MutT (NUDIX family)